MALKLAQSPITEHRPMYEQSDTLRFEQRAHPRIETSGAVMVRFAQSPGDISVRPISIVDVSAEGIGATTPEPIEPGTIVTLTTANARGHEIQSRVARCGVTMNTEGTRSYRLGLSLNTKSPTHPAA